MDSVKSSHTGRESTSYVPGQKATYGTVAAASTILLVWIAGMFGLDVPPEVASAVTTLITAGTVYMVPERKVTL